MMTDVVMPQMGESIVEGTLTKWLKKPGEHVDSEIPSPTAGTLSEVLVEEGKTVSINTVVARIEEGGNGAAPRPKAADTARSVPSAAPPPPPPPAAAPSTVETAEVAGPLSPLVRKMAREHNLDLSRITGTGAGGRITKQDVEAYLAQPAGPPTALPVPAPPAPRAAPAAPPRAPAVSPVPPA